MRKKRYLNLGNIVAIVAGFSLISISFVLKSKGLVDIFEPNALLIVLGGTLCACSLNFSIPKVFNAIRSTKKLILSEEINSYEDIELLSEISVFVKKNGILGLEKIVPKIENHFLRKCLKSCIDINDPEQLEQNLLNYMDFVNKEDNTNIEIFEEMGGYAPTFGIIGAIAGLMQIASSAQSINQLMPGIATAFCATLWGLALANLVFLPISGNYKNVLKDKMNYQKVVIKTVVRICENQSTIVVKEGLEDFKDDFENTKQQNSIFKKLFRKG